ncbi:MAG: hypothetical protein KJ057_16835 [Phycisphaerae bacterium]|nr:MAG: hypothetical protein EDS66_15345 [Planctomycetota bacterium]MCK6466384.1 hypothetical protein [Phycisphaerae bacterium]MCL4720131.1 hypothetical protein [Phycisphaerae bacterium]MCQ3922446.1 hypothetical protein [Planctomycetota bacterium]NUQ10472.1 hypothetical protein [Phycisphaerae bacterium]
MMRRRLFPSVILLPLAAAHADDARAQEGSWTVVYLHPAGYLESEVLAATGSLQGGYASPDSNLGYARPILWKSPRTGLVDLLPEGWRRATIRGMSEGVQVGDIAGEEFNSQFGIVWHGSARDFVIMDPPPGYGSTYLSAVSGDVYVGYAGFRETGMSHAAIWRGTPESFVDLHHPSASWTEAYATDGEFQGGRAKIPRPVLQMHACLWRGTAESFVDMHPEGAKSSVIRGMAPGVQVGEALFDTRHRAVLWHGTPESVVVMSPEASYNSYLYATTGTIHVGYITRLGGCADAGYWTGDAPESFVSLTAHLDPGWDCAAARAISEHKGRLYVAGHASSPQGRTEAVVWISPKLKTTRPAEAP